MPSIKEQPDENPPRDFGYGYGETDDYGNNGAEDMAGRSYGFGTEYAQVTACPLKKEKVGENL
jgi:hypothetical protein